MGKYKAKPKLDTEARLTRPGATSVGLVSAEDRDQHLATQLAHRSHDTSLEGLRLTRATKDRDRIYPRPADSNVNARRGRKALAADEPRTPLTKTQAGHQQRTKRAAQATMPRTEKRALAGLVGSRSTWESHSEALATQARTGQPLTDDQRRDIQRVDRAIRRFEHHNDRIHRVYTGLALDTDIADDPERFLTAGDQFQLDCFTAADHNPGNIPGKATILEITGSRGIYLGSDDPGATNTAHLLPRGITIQIDNITQADVVGDHGATYRRIVQAHIVEES